MNEPTTPYVSIFASIFPTTKLTMRRSDDRAYVTIGDTSTTAIVSGSSDELKRLANTILAELA